MEPFLPLRHLVAVVRMIVIDAQVDKLLLHLVDNLHASGLVLLRQGLHVHSVVAVVVVEKWCFQLVGRMLT